MCDNFTDLNEAYPKDCYPLPKIDAMVDTLASHEMFSFMDVFSNCNQVCMHPDNEIHTTFITDQGLFCFT